MKLKKKLELGRTIKEFKLKYNWRFPGRVNYETQHFYLMFKISGSLIIRTVVKLDKNLNNSSINYLNDNQFY